MEKTLSVRVAAIAFLTSVAFSPAANAITFEQLSASGSGSGVFYTPSISDWVMAPASGDSSILPTSQGWLLSMGQSAFGASETGSQISNVYGAGVVLPESAYGWRVNFSANLRTWDSYNDGSVISPNPGGSLGDWDLFAVNMNQSGFYWNLTSTATSSGAGSEFAATSTDNSTGLGSSLTDPLIPVRPAGSVVSFNNAANDSQYLPGSTWAWGGRDYSAGYFESLQTNGSIDNGNNGPTYVSFVLDTRTPDNSDSGYPSWGQFGTPDVFAAVPDGMTDNGAIGAPGFSAENPILPISLNENGGFVFNEIEVGGESGLGINDFLFIDPEVATGYEFVINAGDVAFSEVLLPTLGDLDGYAIELFVNGEWTTVGSVADGGSFQFDGADTFAFRVTGIDPELGLNPNNFAAFVTGLKFTQAGSINAVMTPLTTAVPEPTTFALMLMGMAALMLTRRGKV